MRSAELIAPGDPGFRALFDTFERSVFRLETRQVYRGPREHALLAEFVAGRPKPEDPAKADWGAMVAFNARAGKVQQRVHVVQEPLTDYLCFELTWGYQPNVEAGEDIRIVTTNDGWPRELPQRHDFWLLDDERLFDMRYSPAGVWLGAERVTDPVAIERACAWQGAALRLGVPWRSYVRERPHLAKHLSLA